MKADPLIRRRRCTIHWAVATLLVCSWHTFGQEKSAEVLRERNVAVPMRDGIVLRADVSRPAGPGPFPVLVLRTPYGKEGTKAEPYVQAGYIVVSQDARGRYASDGKWESFYRFETHDAADGYDTVEWAVKLPGSNGKVGTFGVSYNAFLQWRLAPLRPPSLVAMAASSIMPRLTQLETGGTLRPGRRLNWFYTSMSPDMRARSGAKGPRTKAEAGQLWKEGEGERLLHFLPWLDLPRMVFEDEDEAVKSWLRAPHLDPWKLLEGCPEIAVPNLNIVGWFDHCNDSIELSQTMRRAGKTETARNGQRLIIGPWSHGRNSGSKVGTVNFGKAAAMDAVQTEIRYFDHWLKGKANGVDQDAPVRIFVMGADRWRDEQEWPPARAITHTLYLHSGGHANTPGGDGRLLDRAAASAKDTYRYDPRDPVPTLWSAAMFTLPADQAPLAKRQDILVYQSEPLAAPLEVTGYAEVVLHAASSAPDTDFFARLVDVAPDGTNRDIASGMVRARYRDGLDKPRLLAPGEVIEYRLKLRPTSNEFQPGHRIRLDITSSDFPNYDRNHNTAADQNADARLEAAEQTIHHGGATASRIILPVIPRREVLYNGIELPPQWPPPRHAADVTNGEPMPVPYLKRPPAAVPIDVGRQLFVDDFLIESTTLQRRFHQPVYHAKSPVMRPEMAWEKANDGAWAGAYSDGVFYDEKTKSFLMWYEGAKRVTCLATSGDGIAWSRPSLGVEPGTNIVLKTVRDTATVWLDHEAADPASRFKLFEARYKKSKWQIALHTSPDGRAWSDEIVASGPSWDRSTVFWNPFRKVWVASVRGHDQMKPEPVNRLRCYFEGPTAEAAVSWKQHTDEVARGRGLPNDLQPWVAADRLDPRNPDPRFSHLKPQLYNLDAFPYESLMVGLFTIWQGPDNEACKELNMMKRNEVFAGFSRDGFHWDRASRTPFLPVSDDPKAWNAANVQSVGGGCVVVGDRLYFYCSGRAQAYHGEVSTGLATMRRDGFASMDAEAGEGALTTRSVKFSGKYLFVNVAAANGDLRVEVLDHHGQTIAPFTTENCVPIRADKVTQRVEWKGAEDLSAMAGQAVKFRFQLTKGALHAFWVSPETSGASHGYVAAGGPGFAGATDTTGQ